MKHQRYPNILVVLAALLALVLPRTGWAQFTYTTNNGAITITGYTGSGGNVTIPSMTNGLPVTSIGDSAFYYNTTVKSVTIPDSVTNIGNGAFYLCHLMTNVIMGT
ncbi:MAG: leucine-rich repeat protein, partial [Limisphaerales bacterium]